MESSSGYTAPKEESHDLSGSAMASDIRMKWISRILVTATILLLVVWELFIRGH